MPSKNDMSKNKEQTFESAVERLETIVEQMESDKLPLDDLLVRYEEGMHLVKLCSGKLDAAEKKIEIITRAANGEPQTEPFEPEKPDEKPVSTGGVALF